jgi:hypothetical protein
MRHLALVAFGVTAAVPVALPDPALADETDCRGALGAVTVDDLRVPQGASCDLQGTRSGGNVTVERDAVLRASAIDVEGNVQAENAARVVVAGSRVGGSIQVVQGRGADIADTRVTGDIQIFENGGPASTVRRNAVNGNLQCKENQAPPTGGGNRVGGNAEDQCAGLAGGSGPAATPAPAPPAAPAPGAKRARGKIRILSVRKQRRGRRVVARVRCTAAARCRGTLRVRARGRTVAKRRIDLAARRRATYRFTVPRRHAAKVRRANVRIRFAR